MTKPPVIEALVADQRPQMPRSSVRPLAHVASPTVHQPPLARVLNEACGTYAPAQGWTLENEYGPAPLYSVICQQGVQVTAAGP